MRLLPEKYTFDPIIPVMIFVTLSFIGIIFLYFADDFLRQIPRELFNTVVIIMIIITIPFLIYSGIVKTEKAMEECRIIEEKKKKIDDDIVKKYSEMPDLGERKK